MSPNQAILIAIALLCVGIVLSCTTEHDTTETEYKQNVCLWLSQTDRPEIERDGWPPFNGKPEGCD